MQKEVVQNPFGEAPKSKKSGLKKFLFAVSKEMGLYAPYNSDTLIKTYNYCKEQLGDDFEYYLETVKANITRQEPSKEEGKVAINFLTDVFTKSPQIIQQLEREGKWHSGMPVGWSIDNFGVPKNNKDRFVSQSALGYTFIGQNPEENLPPIIVVYNKEKKSFKRIENLQTGEVIWKENKS